MAEEHRVGHDPEERGADEQTQAGEPERAAGELRGGHEPDRTDHRRREVEGGRELLAAWDLGPGGDRLRVRGRPVGARHGGDARGLALGACVHARDPGPAAHDADRQRDGGGEHDPRRADEEHRVTGAVVTRAQLRAECEQGE